MASPIMTDEQLAEKYGRRKEGVSLFEPCEYGYGCPKGHRGTQICWSEFNEHIWCYKCEIDYPSSECPIKQPSWMTKEQFREFVDKLPFKSKVLRGIDRSLEGT